MSGKDNHHADPDRLHAAHGWNGYRGWLRRRQQFVEVRKRVGYLPETVPLYTDMTAVDYLQFMADLPAYS